MSAANPFNPRLVFGLVAAGIAAFAALLLLLAFGSGQNNRTDGRAHALSVSAIGFKGLVDLVGRFHRAYRIEAPGDFATEDLVVVAIEPQSDPADIARLIDQRHGRATLLILPKWFTRIDPRHRGWVRAAATGAGFATGIQLRRSLQLRTLASPAPGARARGEDFLAGLSMPVPAEPQVIEGKDLRPLVSLPGGGALVARLGDQPHYLVADPDLLNNHGLRDPEAARAAMALIDGLNATDAEGVGFDVTVNRIAGAANPERPSLLRVAFEPPFLAMTLALVFAALLAGLHGAVRFGQARREQRAIALGKAALVENSAGLIRLARREPRLGAAYADLVRQDVARATAAPAWLQGEALDAYLNRLGRPGGPSFSELAAQLYLVRDRHALVAAARALFSWKKDIIR